MKTSSPSSRSNYIAPGDRILRMPEVMDKVGLSRPQIYLLISKGCFPKPIKLTPSGRAAGWLLSEILDYMQSRVDQREAGK